MKSFLTVVMGLLVMSSVAGAGEIDPDNESGLGVPWPGSRTAFSFTQNLGSPVALTAGVYTCGNVALGFNLESWSARRFSPHDEFGLDGCLDINSIDWGVRRFVALLDSIPNPITVDVRLYSIEAGVALEWNNLNLISNTPVVITAADNPVPPAVGVWKHTVVNSQFDPMGGDMDLVVAIHQPDGYSTTPRTRFACSADNSGGQSAYPYYVLADCGYPEFTTPLELGSPSAAMLVLVVNGETCVPVPGACCDLETGACVLVLETACPWGWNGAPTCTPNPCPQLGACCFPDGHCEYVMQAQCTTGDWQVLVPCDPNPCPESGVCCYPDGRCEIRIESTCAGEWQGTGGDCHPNPCPQPSGACCSAGGTCTFVTESLCSGCWLGQGSTCDANPCPQSGPQILYVDPSGSPSTFPWFPTIQAALDWELLGPCDEIVLQDGTFTGPGNRAISFRGKRVTVRSQNGPSQCTVDAQGLDRVFLFVTGETAQSVLDGITITGGCPSAEAYADGGGIYMDGASPTIRNCRITGNGTGTSSWPAGNGGGIACHASSPYLDNCTIDHNNAINHYHAGSFASKGGGLLGDAGSHPVLNHCTISANRSDVDGGGILCSAVDLTDCTISSNAAGASYYYFGGSGGGIYCGTVFLLDCVVTGNSCGYRGSGGGVYTGGGTIGNCSITLNTGETAGAGVTCERTSIYGSTIAGNSGDNTGGLWCSNSQVTGCVITGNTGSSNTYGVGTGGIQASNSTISGCTISGNCLRSTYGPNAGGLSASNSQVTQTIIWGNTATIPQNHDVFGENLTITCCDLDASGTSGTISYVGPQLFLDPLFCAPQACQDEPSTGGNYAVGPESPCLPQNSPCGLLIGALGEGCPDPAHVIAPPTGTGGGLRVLLLPNPYPVGATILLQGPPQDATVEATVCGPDGRRLRRLAVQAHGVGMFEAKWDGNDSQGRAASSGVYFLRVSAGGERATQRFLLWK